MQAESVGLVKIASVLSVNKQNNTMEVRVEGFSTSISANKITIPLVITYYSINGINVGSIPSPGTPIIIQQGSGGQWYFSTYLNKSTDNSLLDSDSYTIYADKNTYIKISKEDSIILGNKNKNIFISTDNTNNFVSTYFDSLYSFTKGTRSFSGPIKRDLYPNPNISNDLKLHDPIYETYLRSVGFDNTLTANKYKNTIDKNPELIEKRSLITEFPEDSNVLDDLLESDNYGVENIEITEYKYENRRRNRTDVLGLSLTHPNYLIEKIEGTVVDYFGNILDLNRYPLPIKDKFSLNAEEDSKATSKKDNYINLRGLHRRGMAFHFELNSRKDFIQDGKIKFPSIEDNIDYSRSRSRFFIDIDKEGQIKANISASSESGNIPILSRYENFSYISDEDDNNPNKVIAREDNLDILHDSFVADSYDIFSDEQDKYKGGIAIEYTDANTNIVDRITGNVLKHGTAYHDITNILYSFKRKDFFDYQYHPDTIINVDDLLYKDDFVNKTITIGKNAGGRSGQINLDGSLEVNIGANTSDRHSLWLDLAGGIVSQVGRDRNNNSAVSSFDGNVLVQIGGFGVNSDSRFKDLNNMFIDGKLDIRVLTSGNLESIIRIDNSGITIMSPQQMKLYSSGDMSIQCDATLRMNSEECFIQNRLVAKETLGGI